MNKLSLALIFLVLVSGSAKASKGGGGTTTVGNGGYSLQCGQGDELQSYDLFETQKEMGEDFKVRPVVSYQESLYTISALITKKLPEMDYSFGKFVQQIGNQDPLLQYVWDPTPPWAVTPLYWEPARTLTLCRSTPRPSLVTLSQVILRKPLEQSQGEFPGETHVIFYYDQTLLDDLNALDRSFLLVHEWLWNFTNDSEANRKADYLLHSRWFDHASSKQVIRELKKIGIQYPHSGS